MNWLFGFEGRANRAKYLVAIAIYLIPLSVGSLIADHGTPELGALILIFFALLLSMPAAKRLHDLNHSGWWQALGLVPLVNFGLVIYMIFWRGTTGPNRFGSDPLAEENVTSPSSTSERVAPRTVVPSATQGLEFGLSSSNSSQHTLPLAEKSMNTTSPMSHQIPDEDAVFEVVANEMDSGKLDKGLWTRLFAEMEGDEKKTKIAYIKRRAEKILAAERIRLQDLAKQQAEDAERLENLRLERLSIREKLASAKLTPELLGIIQQLSSTSTALTFLSNVRLNKMEQVARQLDENPLYVAVATSEGATALHISVDERYLSMSELLIRHGARVNQANSAGQTPLDVARKSGNQDLINLLSAI